MNNLALCQCGCEEHAGFYLYNDYKDGAIKGQPRKFIRGHSNRGENNGQWKGGRRISYGYISLHLPGHPHATANGYVSEHIAVASHALGKPLPPKVVVHHINENKADNRNSNLVICQDGAYHKFLHRRIRTLKACGNANYRKCWICKKYDDPSSMHLRGRSGSSSLYFFHLECNRTYRRALKRKHKAAKLIKEKGALSL